MPQGMAHEETLTQGEEVYYKLQLASPAVQERVKECAEDIRTFEADVGIAAVGPTSAGKSALVNTVASFLSNHLELVAGASKGTDGMAHHVLGCSRNPMKWKICEPPGAVVDELILQQQGAPVQEEAEDGVACHDVVQFVEKVLRPLVDAGIGCIVCIMPATEFPNDASSQRSAIEPRKDSLLANYLKALKQLHRQATCAGMHMICMITKVDLHDAKVAEDVAEVATSRRVDIIRRCISTHTQLPLNQVFPSVALVHDLSPSDNPALGYLSLFPALFALRAAANSSAYRSLSAAHLTAKLQHEARGGVDLHQHTGSHPCEATESLKDSTPLSCQQELLANTEEDALMDSFGAFAVDPDPGFGRMRGGAVGDSDVGERSTHSAIHDARNADVQIYINGEFFHRSEAKISVFDSGFLVGDGIWEGLRLHHGKFAFLDKHMARLRAASKITDIPIPSEEELTVALYDTIKRNSMSDSVHARLMITRGNKKTPSQHPSNVISGPNVIIIAEHKRADPEAAAGGLNLFTSTIRRPPPDTLDQRINCHSKLHEVIALIQAVKAGADEALMLDTAGAVATCNATNFFIVTAGTVVTSTGLHNLHGITREVVLSVARRSGIHTAERSFSLMDVYSADEAFATGTFGGLTAVSQVDGRSIGTGDIPGPFTKHLQALYTTAVEADVA